MSLLNKWKKLLAIKSIARYICYQEIFILEGKFLACENSRFSGEEQGETAVFSG